MLSPMFLAAATIHLKKCVTATKDTLLDAHPLLYRSFLNVLQIGLPPRQEVSPASGPDNKEPNKARIRISPSSNPSCKKQIITQQAKPTSKHRR